MTTKLGRLYIGTSGYQYDHWRGKFYPKDLPKSAWFKYYADRFDTVEINNTFYNLPEEATFKKWRGAAPKGFTYALKYSRYGTHMKRLKDPASHLDNFVPRAKLLGPRLGPILVQLPPNWHADPERLDAFLGAAPRALRWCVEFRDKSWLVSDIFDVLRKYAAALCIHDMIDDHPRELTSDWTYMRFHGDHYEGSYSGQALWGFARFIINRLLDGIDVYAYFNNDQRAFAPQNATRLREMIEDKL